MKRNLKKFICLTLCCLVMSSVVVSAKVKNNSNNHKSCYMSAIDPFPHESDPPK